MSTPDLKVGDRVRMTAEEREAIGAYWEHGTQPVTPARLIQARVHVLALLADLAAAEQRVGALEKLIAWPVQMGIVVNHLGWVDWKAMVRALLAPQTAEPPEGGSR